ncbi:hypothetical protein P7D22_04650 [Lichenihabitans sp. Uapishka_5]|uniref:hypothetical protein n=1 Tax=Lichenihabitans sp. Uapishka_5 TaxID=3037302 RepID=UPI0029E80C14|nr:hypothetical protein [Lichenihabitans sp. Uapishka_5]MDX7950469.1 hypothetical protein [Lichenihabitans sp. Uapishka_5]
MALTVSSNGGNSLADLLRQARQAKPTDETTAASDLPTGATQRSTPRSGFDSTGSGTAQVAAALTVYLSKTGGPAENETAAPAATSQASRSSASELLRALDAYSWAATSAA